MLKISIRFFTAILLLQTAILLVPNRLRAEPAASVALNGRVSSQEEGPMEGVLVSAKRDGATVTTTVVSDAGGNYSFPAKRLEPGRYSVRIRAAGYELKGLGSVAIAPNKTAQLNLKLGKSSDLASQLTNAEWLLSAPGTDDQKKALLNCQHCHTMERIFRSHHDAAELTKTMRRMGTYYEGTLPQRPQLLKPMPEAVREYFSPKDVDYVSSIILGSKAQWPYPLKTLPRPKGEATRVIITEYDLPRQNAMPHDAVVDSTVMVWYSDHGQQFLGRLDPATAKVVEFPIPLLKPGYPTGFHFLEFDQDGNIWLSMGAQGGVAKFDPKTQEVKTWNLPKSTDNPEPSAFALLVESLRSSGKIWVMESTGRRIQQLDVRSGNWSEPINLFQDIPKDSPAAARRHFVYDMHSDAKNTAYLWDYYSEYIGKMDIPTGKMKLFQTPTLDSGPRRGHIDKQGRVWFGEYRGNRIGMFDPSTERFQEWEMPTPFSGPYDVIVDKNGYAWTGGMTSDRVARLNTKTGEIIEYLLPRPTNIRRVDVDNSTNPVSFWAGSNHGGSIVKLEPLE